MHFNRTVSSPNALTLECAENVSNNKSISQEWPTRYGDNKTKEL